MPKMSRQKKRRGGGKRHRPQFKREKAAVKARSELKVAIKAASTPVPGRSLDSASPLDLAAEIVQELHEETQTFQGV